MAFVTCAQLKPLQDFQNTKIASNEAELQRALEAHNAKLKALQDALLAKAQADKEGNYRRIKELEAQIDGLQGDLIAGKNDLSEALLKLKGSGVSDEVFNTIVAKVLANANTRPGKQVKAMTANPDGSVTITYTDGSTENIRDSVVATDQKTIVGNGGSALLKVKVSPAADNLLKVTDEGLAVTQKAKYPSLFVDYENGSDENIGTRAKPLKTIQEALSRNDANTIVSIYLKEEVEHIVDRSKEEIVFKTGTIRVYPYGEKIDRSLNEDPRVVDAQWARRYAVEEKRSAKIVFKGIKPFKFPHQEMSGRPQVNLYDKSVIFIGDNTNVVFDGIHFVDDLGFSISLENMEAQKRDLAEMAQNRINVGGSGTLTVTAFTLETRNRPTVTDTDGQSLNYVRSRTNGSVNLLEAKDAKGLYRTGIFGMHSQSGGAITLSRLYHTNLTFEEYVISPSGWNTGMLASKTLSLLALTPTERQWVVDKVYQWVTDATDRVVLAPTTDISYSMVTEGNT
ncbi:hypothetical protein E4T80_09880 [Muribacter muris]|uniref:Uncharacterized protein n=1 Tax=Muribacter muris TaxID=67855 RepID=A0A4Y9JUL5_9PAST|nr:hypothetical protein [Muribacter muris]MBF0785767.1 hypothetical protein [Muribacter muris]MBF0828261.1 hypothetical protein [Muribacter muris]TFV08589.1 hypothetical protein E4T80_09880 [Muribacter muris]